MNRNKIRHKILRILMENYKEVDAKYGDGDGMGFIAPIDEHRLSIPVKEIIKRLKISNDDYETAITQAFRDKTVKHDETNDMEDCLVMAENTRIYYNERTYLKRINFKESHPLLYDICLIAFGAAFSTFITIVGGSLQGKDHQEQDKINLRQDSTINSLKSLLHAIEKKDSI